MNGEHPLFVAERFGVILGAGNSREAAAAAAAARVSRADVRHATPDEARRQYLWERRTLPETERALLEAIRADINMLLAVARCDCPSGLMACNLTSDCDLARTPRFGEYEIDVIDDDTYYALEARRDAIADELAELRALEGQADLFGAAA